MSIKYKTT